MSRTIKKATVLGSGVMGSAIAAHLAGCGVDVLMLDIVPTDDMLTDAEKAKKNSPAIRNKVAATALAESLKSKMPKFYSKKDAARVQIGNLEDDIAKIADSDWIVEAVVEDMAVKKKLWKEVDKHRRADSIVSTNTSGLSVEGMVEDCSDDMKEHFLGTHFFNPVRFMKLLEIIPHPQTKPDILDFMAKYCAEDLGKGVVWCKDTPNFIGNRIGVYGINSTMYLMQEFDLRIDEVDAIVGKPLGRPGSAAFRTSDLVGLDTMGHVANTVYENVPDDEERDVFAAPDFLKELVKRKWLGDKTKGGFYKRAGKDRLVLDYKTMEYVPAGRPEFESINKAKAAKGLPGKIKAFVMDGDDKAAQFAWKATAKGLIYAANRIPEISDSVVEVDHALEWGFNWSLGPFRTWDAIGVAESVERMKKDGMKVPAHVEEMLSKGNTSFYKKEGNTEYAYSLVEQKYVEIPKDPRILLLKTEAGAKEVEKNDSATIWDIGDGVICLEFHSKMNAIDPDIMNLHSRAMDLLDEGKFEAMVVANHAENFCVGANIFIMLMAVMNDQHQAVEDGLKLMQDNVMRMKYHRQPCVVAPAGQALGGGCEFVMHGQLVTGAAETYAGLVELGVGLIPAGGGTKELVVRMVDSIPDGSNPPMLPFLQKAFETIAMAKFSMGFKEAQELGFVSDEDIMVPNRDFVIGRAKDAALGMLKMGFNPGSPRTDIPVGGATAEAAMLIGLDGML
ncbi:3-hydroxyacyl-CoA dehydrogenase/enoyl-CoA hydratase family protein, partial [bacterium]|nr:3-hydroxyacyl-CoA dehydrogenase/enoyl-CoA hydratase family protein [bacterium]